MNTCLPCDTRKQRIRLLIADDAPRSRNGLRALLATLRLNGLATRPPAPIEPQVDVVGEAVDGHEAVCMVAECRPDVVLMDARMPVMDGLTATRQIKKRWPEVKVVVLTLYASYRAEAMASGADAFLLKGCPPEELLEAILGN
ncbi:MAG: response regulator transcription factor [Anaerolineales bacterium]|nr:MAG: response regulator transcription factor [Anaerolineales bacterium]